MVEMDSGFARRKFLCHLFAGLDIKNDGTTLFGDHGVIVVENAGILSDGVEWNAKRTEGFTMHGVSMGGCDDFGTRAMYRRVNHEGRTIDGHCSMDDFTMMVD